MPLRVGDRVKWVPLTGLFGVTQWANMGGPNVTQWEALPEPACVASFGHISIG